MNLSIRRSERRLTSAPLLLLLGFVCGFGGVLLFLNVYFGGSPFLPGYLAWERSLIGATAVAISFGFGLLAASLRAAGERLFSWIGLGTLALGTALTLLVEGRAVATGQDWQGGMQLLIGALVVLSFIGQAAYGAALLRTALLPHWVGWLLVLWNLAWLAIVFAFSASDPYYPVLFYVCPLVLGLLLVWPSRGGRMNEQCLREALSTYADLARAHQRMVVLKPDTSGPEHGPRSAFGVIPHLSCWDRLALPARC